MIIIQHDVPNSWKLQFTVKSENESGGVKYFALVAETVIFLIVADSENSTPCMIHTFAGLHDDMANMFKLNHTLDPAVELVSRTEAEELAIAIGECLYRDGNHAYSEDYWCVINNISPIEIAAHVRGTMVELTYD